MKKLENLIIINILFQVPYYLLNPDAVFPEAFRYVQLPAFKYIIGAGALTGLFAFSFSFCMKIFLKDYLLHYSVHFYHYPAFYMQLLLMD
jgi:hypothetical protein